MWTHIVFLTCFCKGNLERTILIHHFENSQSKLLVVYQHLRGQWICILTQWSKHVTRFCLVVSSYGETFRIICIFLRN